VDTGSGNVYIGASVEAADPAEHDHTYIRNINTTSVSGPGTDTVTVDLTTGLLGHLTSSRRYKQDIHPMDNASETLYRLKPVTYRYKKEIDRSQGVDYGLIAEEVAEVDPNLAVRDRKGQIESVRYNAINAMLLNEFLKEHRKVQELDATVAQQQKDFQATIAQLTARLEEQVSEIQRVSAQLELSNHASRTAATKGR
jgi:Chaperone of endosialidase